jgi:hypothetical protein
LVEQAAWAYDMQNVQLHRVGSGELNIMLGFGGKVPALELVDRCLVFERERQEDLEARERLEAGQCDTAMVEKLEEIIPGHTEEEGR